MSSEMNDQADSVMQNTAHHPRSGTERLLALPRHVKIGILLAADFLVSITCLFFALSLRFGFIDNHISVLALGDRKSVV